jgi:beta-lactamase class A
MRKTRKRILICLLAFALALQMPVNVSAAKKKKGKVTLRMEKLEKQINNYIKNSCPAGVSGNSGAEGWSVYVKDLKNNKSFTINDHYFLSASTIKLFAMATAYDQAKKKKLNMDAAMEARIRSMITVSSNEAFNTLVYSYLGEGTINKFTKANKYLSTQQYTACGNGGSGTTKFNITSAKDCGKLLEKIYRGKLVSKSASRKMLSYLMSQTIRTKIPQGVPYGITVANKTGEYDKVENDVAIVYGKKTNYIICVFSNTENPTMARSCIAEISRMVYQALN